MPPRLAPLLRYATAPRCAAESCEGCFRLCPRYAAFRFPDFAGHVAESFRFIITIATLRRAPSILRCRRSFELPPQTAHARILRRHAIAAAASQPLR